MPITYYPTKPLATDKLVNSQGDIQTNFTGINAFVNIDHVDFTLANAGKHAKVSIPVSAVAPAVAAAEMVLYTKTVSGTTQLFYKRDGGATEVDMTSGLQNAIGWTRLPSGLLVKWGNATTPRNALQLYTYPVGATIPAFSAIYTVLVSQTFAAGLDTGELNVAISAGVLTTTNFEVFARAIGLPNNGNVSFNYIAIGI